MTPSEFIFKLKSLPPETPMTANHIIAILEALSPSPQGKVQNLDDLPNAKLIDEDALADWIGESPSTLQKWRLTGKGPKYVKKPKNISYKVGDVKDWLDNLTVASTAESHVRLNRLEQEFFRPVPYMLTTITPEPMPFFQSLALDEDAVEGFTLEWVEYYSRPQENITAWLYHNIGNGRIGDLVRQVEEFIRSGSDVNGIATKILGDQIQRFTITDLMAEFRGVDLDYGDLLIALLDNGLDISKIKEAEEQFKRGVNSYNLYLKLNRTIKNN